MYNLAIKMHAKQGTKLYEPKDFYPNWTGIEQQQEMTMSPQDMKHFFRNFRKEQKERLKKQKAREGKMQKQGTKDE